MCFKVLIWSDLYVMENSIFALIQTSCTIYSNSKLRTWS